MVAIGAQSGHPIGQGRMVSRRVVSRLAVVLTLTLAAIACSDGEDGDAPVASGSGSVPSEEELEAALLTIDDMPSGWSDATETIDTEADPCGVLATMPEGFDPDEAIRVLVAFTGSERYGPLVTNTVGFVPDGHSAEWLRLAEEAYAACDAHEADGLRTSATMLSFPTVGDDSFAVRITYEALDGAAPFDIDFVFTRTGDLIVLTSAWDPFRSATPLIEEYAPLAVERATDTGLG